MRGREEEEKKKKEKKKKERKRKEWMKIEGGVDERRSDVSEMTERRHVRCEM